MNHPFSHVTPYDQETGDVNVVIDTPKGSRNKYSLDEQLGLFQLTGVLAAGHVFPYDFGFIPNTLGGDGDPVDVLVLMDEAAFTGCLVRARLIGVITAEQTERQGQTEGNDRLIAVAAKSPAHASIKSLDDLDPVLMDQIEHFFVSYNEAKGKTFKPLGRFGPDKARTIVDRAIGDAKD
ncbi:MAG: inorganic diphosphatase [Pyrinomonadaceae bacterium]